LTEHWFLVRLIEAPADPLPLAHHKLVLGRGPFEEDAEAKLLHGHGIEVLVSKNSGGQGAYGKIAAARRLALPVVMIDRPPPPPGETVATVEKALAWIEARTAGAGNP
jgi:precorrin-6A/cobalt-precorrin-6A reductase